MDVNEEISLRSAIEYCIENNDSRSATTRVIEYIKDSLKAQMEQFDLYIVNRSLQKVCKGCGSLNTDKPKGKLGVCCPDNNYISLDDYLKHSIYLEKLKDKL